MNEAPHSPIRTLSYSLTRADALAYKLLKHELTGWTIAVLVMGLFGVLAIVWTNVSVRRQAAAIPLPEGVVELEEWSDRLIERSAVGVRSVAFEQIAQVIRTDGYIFIREGAAPLIIPKTAFNDAEDMRVFAEGIDKASDRAQP
jgi:hypothetical protein